MADIKVELFPGACREILNSPEVQSACLSRAERIKSAADSFGSGRYSADVRPGRNRAHAMVKTTDIISRKSNAKHNTLLRAMNAGRF